MALLNTMVKIAIILILPVFLIIPQNANSYSIGNSLIPGSYIVSNHTNMTYHISYTTGTDACSADILLNDTAPQTK